MVQLLDTVPAEGLWPEDLCLLFHLRNSTVVPGAASLSHGQMMFPSHEGKALLASQEKLATMQK